MKNSFANVMRERQKDWTIRGVQVGFYAITIALNREFGFGRERLLRLQDKGNEIVNKVFCEDDPEFALTQLEEGCKQIMKE